MRKRKWATVAILLLAGFVIVLPAQRPRIETNDPQKHHQDLTLRVSVDRPQVFTLPATNTPVRMDLSAVPVGSTDGAVANPILRSATILHAALTDSIFFTNGDDSATLLTETGLAFENHPDGGDGIHMRIVVGLPAGRWTRDIQISMPEAMSAGGQLFYNEVDVRLSLWY